MISSWYTLKTYPKILENVLTIKAQAFAGDRSLSNIILPFVGEYRVATNDKDTTTFGYIFSPVSANETNEIPNEFSPNSYATSQESFVNNKSENILGGDNSARIGFVYLGTTNDTVNAGPAQYLANANGSVIWEPNYDTHADHGIENALNIYGIVTTETGAPRLPYKGINSEIKGQGVLLTETNNSPYFSDVNPQIATIKGFADDQNLLTLPRGISKLRIYFWLEGQDVDMENEISGAELEFKLEMAVS